VALQRAPLEHRAAAAPEPRVARLARGHGGQARRGAGPHPLLIHTLPIPTPFQVGRVNTYLIDDDPLTLVDTGPNSGKALDELEQALASHGRRIEDLELIVLTHQHIDHVGLVEILARRSGAEVAALDLLAPWLAEYGRRMEADDTFAEQLMSRHGVPRDVGYALRAVSSAFRAWGSKGTVTMPLADGAELRLRDRTFRVLHRPGHSPSDTVFHDAEHRVLIGGDHLIAHISSNPLITRPLAGDDDERPKALLIYLESLRATQAMDDVDVVLPGHGSEVRNRAELIDQRFRMHERRAAKIRGLVADEPLTAHEIAQRLWGDVALTQAFLTLSEVLGHLDLLAERGEVVEELDAGISRFRTTA
jgi:glyoxylase-like metal-dependent hydrolase (beta-lactamase superfamily II)